MPDSRILWLTDHYHPAQGGMARSCDRIVYYLRQAGWKIDIIHFQPSRETTQLNQWENRIGGRDLACPIVFDRPYTLNLIWHLIRQSDYSHIVAFGSDTPFLAGPVYAQWLSIPLLTFLRGNDFDEGVFSKKNRNMLLDCLEKSSSIAAVSSELRDRLLSMYPEKNILFTPNGIDLNQWRALPSHETETKTEDAIILGLVGHMKSKKGIHFLLNTILQHGLNQHLSLIHI